MVCYNEDIEMKYKIRKKFTGQKREELQLFPKCKAVKDGGS